MSQRSFKDAPEEYQEMIYETVNNILNCFPYPENGNQHLFIVNCLNISLYECFLRTTEIRRSFDESFGCIKAMIDRYEEVYPERFMSSDTKEPNL